MKWKLLPKVGRLAEDLLRGVATESQSVVSQKAARTMGSSHGQKVSGSVSVFATVHSQEIRIKTSTAG